MGKHQKTIESLESILNARSVAVVGASNEPHKFGYMTLDSILRGGYEGKLYAVNPKGGKILGRKAYPSLSEVPGTIDVVIIVVPAKLVPTVLRDAAAKGAKGAIIQSAGFREAGRLDLEEEILAISREYGIRLMGPNIQGINYLPNRLCAMFFPVIKTKGPLAIVSQSGSVTAALSEWAERDGLGISAAINLGNQVDLCEADYIDFFTEDDNTNVIVMYLEGIRDGGRFLAALERASCKKPVAVLKSGRTDAGAKSAASHTGSMAGSYEVFCAACRQYGAVVMDDLMTLYDVAKALAGLKTPKGKRLVTISTSGGAGTLSSDEAESRDLNVPPLPVELKDELGRLDLSPLAHISNPLDLAGITADHFLQASRLVDHHDAADIILISFADPVVGGIKVIKTLKTDIKASLAVSYMGGGEEEIKGGLEIQKIGVPVFPTPERAIRGIAAAVQYARYLQTKKQGPSEIFSTDKEKWDYADKDQRFILEPEAIGYLSDYYIPYPDHGVAHSTEEAVEIADRLGYPVVIKVVSPDTPHKTDVKGVVVGLQSSDEVKDCFNQIHEDVKRAVPSASIEGILVCKQAPEGLDVIVGALYDPIFGPITMFGLGGIFTEVLRDVIFRVAPLRRHDAEEMVSEIKGYPLLKGVRGQPKYDTERLIELLMSISRMAIDRPEIKELDLNPVRLFENGLMALDIRLLKREASK